MRLLQHTVSSSCVAPVARTRKSVCARAQATSISQRAAEPTAPPAEADSGLQDIYLGFQKDDTAPREGRQGRVIKDDPSKYPAKEDLGPFLGATGGWAGGEAALWQLIEQVEREKEASKSGSQKTAVSSSSSSNSSRRKAQLPPAKGDLAPIYMGYGKDELEVRKSGQPGRVILDDPKKYPSKENLGFFAGATGGFAGGEKGLEQYITTGELKLRQPGQPGPRQTSPVAIAGLLVAAGAGGGLLLNEFADLGENAVKTEILGAPVDEKTKTLLLAAVVLLGGVGVLASGRALVQRLQERLSSRITSAGGQAQKLVVAGAFWLAVFFAGRFVLEL